MVDNIPDVVPLCPKCGSRMVKNGQKKLTKESGGRTQNWICKKCGRQRVEPSKEHLSALHQDGDI